MWIQEQEDAEKHEEQVMNHIQQWIQSDMTKVEETYENIFDKLGTQDVDQIQSKI